jgi:hypothetical protein
MLDSWYNCFFVSYDAGFVSVDKPPLGFWKLWAEEPQRSWISDILVAAR